MDISNKNILVGVSGGIAAYKTANLVSLLRKNGASIRVIMTESAKEFISPITFQALTGFPARSDMFTDWSESFIPHISNSEWADAIVIVPATANIIGKIAHGIADDLVTTTVLAADMPVIVCPAMNAKMYNNPLFQKNLEILRDFGVRIVYPETGELACGQEGKGRLADIDEIMNSVYEVFTKQDLKSKRVLITAGGTREALDPVRFISNRSSGKTGYALASAAKRRGADVILITASEHLPIPSGVESVRVESAKDMYRECCRYFSEVDILIMAAAVSDFEPLEQQPKKIKKGSKEWGYFCLQPTPDILGELSKRKKKQLIIGFCAESENLELHAKEKLERKDLDLIVANDISKDIFGSDFTSIIIIDALGYKEEHLSLDKKTAADYILDAAKRSVLN